MSNLPATEHNAQHGVHSVERKTAAYVSDKKKFSNQKRDYSDTFAFFLKQDIFIHIHIWIYQQNLVLNEIIH